MARTLSLSKVFETVGYEPHEGQKKIHLAKGSHRFRWVSAGRRFGKSNSGGHELTAHAYEAYAKREQLDGHGKRMEYWIVGPEYSDSEKEFRVLYKDLESREFPFDRPGTYYDAVGGNMHISLFDGKFQVHAKSAKYPDQLVGEGLHGAILAEAAKLKPSIWPKYLRPMLVDYRGWSLATSTPEGKNWFYDECMKYLDPEKYPEYWFLRAPSWSNTALFPLGREDPEVASLGAGLTDEAFKQEIGAEFTEFVGRVFKRFDEEVHVKPIAFNPALATYAASDYGFTNPFVWLLIQVDHWDNVYVLDEIYQSNLTIEEAADLIESKQLAPKQMRMFYPDPASPGDTRYLEGRFRIRGSEHTGGEIRDRINLIRRHLEVPKHLLHLPDGHQDKQPKLFVHPRCVNFIREFNDYRYPENKNESTTNERENPMKKDDHTPEALGRFFMGYFGRNQETSRSRVRKSNLSGSR